MEKRKGFRLAVLIAGLAAIVCAIAIVGFGQNTATSRVRGSRAVPMVPVGYQRTTGSTAAHDTQPSADAGAASVSAQVGEAADDPLQAIPSHKRYVIVGERYLPTGEDVIPMGVIKAERQ